ELPKIKNPSWPINEIDHFVFEKMTEMGLSPNKPASKMHLLKRLSLDITGLPPSLQLMEEFENSEGYESYDLMVDRLLAQPGFGEKLAILWMDVSRYSDSYGYQDDNIRTQWPY